MSFNVNEYQTLLQQMNDLDTKLSNKIENKNTLYSNQLLDNISDFTKNVQLFTFLKNDSQRKQKNKTNSSKLMDEQLLMTSRSFYYFGLSFFTILLVIGCIAIINLKQNE